MRVEYDQEVREWGGWSARQVAIASWWSKNAAHCILHEPLAARTRSSVSCRGSLRGGQDKYKMGVIINSLCLWTCPPIFDDLAS